jgi:hypothetical protein
MPNCLKKLGMKNKFKNHLFGNQNAQNESSSITFHNNFINSENSKILIYPFNSLQLI